METINHYATAAAKAVWGESGEEPVSGKKGDVAKGEPYDAGNIGEQPEHIEYVEPSATKINASTTNPIAVTSPTSQAKAPEQVANEQQQQSSTTKTTENDATTSSSYSSPDFTKPLPERNPERSSSGGANLDSSTPNPAQALGSSAMPGDSTKAQNDVRDPSNPDAHHDSAATKNNVDDSGEGLDKDDNPVKLDGPGPRPLEEIAREHGGNAAAVNEDGAATNGSAAGKKDKSSSGDSVAANGGGAPKLDDDKSNEDGDGTQYVKSSGLVADGGDFDATKPGAGREADRLLEEKGVHREGPNGGVVGNDGAADGKHKDKVSLKDKIKAKLHKGSTTASA
ncbi:hypothetical protein B0T17DRAFT_507161 [Bombardia bombarda]|uniref:Uncharacterized protein n=1 Tax=Bombardia bombarda TaxID=252184 RepID=A0AA39XBP0_9PEZI|nr:hypothetical protein B0T17DRAFT_507161 [Bombardia bombarda]